MATETTDGRTHCRQELPHTRSQTPFMTPTAFDPDRGAGPDITPGQEKECVAFVEPCTRVGLL